MKAGTFKKYLIEMLTLIIDTYDTVILVFLQLWVVF